ncbi:glycerate kinase [Leifsonia shinshuensis]|uniref:Glycerate kinase n=1 Tax=Leifsonia shinshuensis TaxID=150026 RepID=A0A7G6YAU4_9MICO|nr:glycerate kinase [Leifsonia shinshuensis]QNE35609.1 glycerate kinase [Leifsonia shinshuensis]
MPSRIVVAPDSFKGSLTAAQAARAIAEGIRAEGGSHVVVERPIADGGEGTIDALVASGAQPHELVVPGALGADARARWASLAGTAYIEAAQGAGAHHVPDPGPRGCVRATSRGVGALISAALDAGYRDLVLTTGGTAVSDGGAGLLGALGLTAQPDGSLFSGGGALTDVRGVDVGALDPRLRDVRLRVALDVGNPLLGENGSAAVFAPQKGAGEREVALLEAGLAHWAGLFDGGRDAALLPGAGASGGIGFAALAVLGAQPVGGADVVLELMDFAADVRAADLVVVGEGSLDRQSLAGKAPVVAAGHAMSRGVPAVAIAGRVALDADELASRGIRASWSLAALSGSVDAAQAEPVRWLVEAGRRLAEWLPSLQRP